MQHPSGSGSTGCPILNFCLSGRSAQPPPYVTIVRAVEPLAGEAWLAEVGRWGSHLKALPAVAPAQLSAPWATAM